MNIFRILWCIALIGWLFHLIKYIMCLKKRDYDDMNVNCIWLCVFITLLTILNALSK